MDLNAGDTQSLLATEINVAQHHLNQLEARPETAIWMSKMIVIFLYRSRRNTLIRQWEGLSGQKWVESGD